MSCMEQACTGEDSSCVEGDTYTEDDLKAKSALLEEENDALGKENKILKVNWRRKQIL